MSAYSTKRSFKGRTSRIFIIYYHDVSTLAVTIFTLTIIISHFLHNI